MNAFRQAIQERRQRYEKLLQRGDMRALVRRELETAIEELQWVERELGLGAAPGGQPEATQPNLFHHEPSHHSPAVSA